MHAILRRALDEADEGIIEHRRRDPAGFQRMMAQLRRRVMRRYGRRDGEKHMAWVLRRLEAAEARLDAREAGAGQPVEQAPPDNTGQRGENHAS